MSNQRYVRVRLVYPEDESDQPYTLDLFLDAADRAVGPSLIFGACGRFDRAEERFPFMLDPDGRIDFGAAMATAEERYWRTDLRNVALREGALVTLWDPSHQAWRYVVKRVLPLEPKPIEASTTPAESTAVDG